MNDQAREATVALPMPRGCPLHPPAEFAELRAERPLTKALLPSGQEAWVFTRYEHVRQVLTDPRLSADVHSEGFPVLHEEPVELPMQDTIMRADGKDHHRIRLLLNREFTVKRAEAMRPIVTRIVDGCLDELEAAGPPADLIQRLAMPLPAITICTMLGIPAEDRPFFEKSAKTLLDTAVTQEQLRLVMEQVGQYLDGLIARKEADPQDDIISRLVVEMRQGNLGRAEFISSLGVLLFAGFETSAAQIGLSVLALLEHPDQLALLRDDPGLMPDAVEELLRHQTVIQVPITRAALEDLEIGGQRIRAGEGVLALIQSANRDERVFDDADRLDLRRGSRSHIAFSFGPHQCVGHALARVELQVVLSALLRRFPTMRLAGTIDEVEFRPHSAGIFGVERLPVTW